jgi:hypothetical protein
MNPEDYYGMYGASEGDGAPIEVNGPDVAPIPSPDAPPPPSPNAEPWTVSIQNGALNAPRDYHYTNGVLDPNEAQAQAQELQQIQRQIQQGDPIGRVASGPHSDLFDYQYTEQQKQRMAYLNKQNDLIAQQQHMPTSMKTSMMSRNNQELASMKPQAIPKKKTPQQSIQEQLWVHPDTGSIYSMTKDGTPHLLEHASDKPTRAPTPAEFGKMINDYITQHTSGGEKGADGKTSPINIPSRDEAISGVMKDLEAYRKAFGRKNPADPWGEPPAQNPPGQINPAFADLNNEVSQAQSEYNSIKKQFPKGATSAPPDVRKRVMELRAAGAR